MNSQHSLSPFLQAARGQKTAHHPVWFMRQAGRYLPEYRELRAQTDFVTRCKTPDIAAEITIQPMRRYDLDAAIIFSDILIPCIGMGQHLSFDAGHGPRLTPHVRSLADVHHLRTPNAQRDLGFVGEAIARVKTMLKSHQAMLGFAGAPFTVASYMIEGAGSKEYTEVKRFMYRDPAGFKALLDKLADVTVDYLRMQIVAGADAVMLFDSWAGNLTPHDYATFVLGPTRHVLKTVREKTGVPVIYYPGQGMDRHHCFTGLEVDVIQVDWRSSMRQVGAVFRSIGLDVTLQGNLDPQILMGSESYVRERVRMVIEDAKHSQARAHIFNVGHGLMPHIPPESLTWVIDELRQA